MRTPRGWLLACLGVLLAASPAQAQLDPLLNPAARTTELLREVFAKR